MEPTTSVVDPPEVVLDRFVRNKLRFEKGLSGYIGKLDLDKQEPSLGAFLGLFQDTMNEALRNENANASGGVDHPPFHFDYLEVNNGVPPNAFAFEEGDYAFIVVTEPLVHACGDLSLRLCNSPIVTRLLRPQGEAKEVGELQELLFQNLMSLVVAHEYTHHVHKHNSGVGAVVWTEFSSSAEDGGLPRQAQELDADGYAAYILLQHLLRGSARPNALARLKQHELLPNEADQLLLALFFITSLALFCEFWTWPRAEASSFYLASHPPPPIGIKYILEVAKMWCDQNELESIWFIPARSQELFRAVAGVFESSGKATWDAQMASLTGPAGVEYDGELFKAFEAVRQNQVLPPDLETP